MSKSSRSGGVRGSGTVTVIEAKVHRSAHRNARIAFTLACLVCGALGALIASAWLPATLALLVGLWSGLVVGMLAYGCVRVWTFARVVWWWLPELLAMAVFAEAWSLVDRLPLPARAAVLTAIVAVLLIPRVRRQLVSLAWCFVVRHRLRVCFAQFIVANQSGSLPLILWARPTPVGERVWIYLRPGLSVPDLESRLERIAVVCHASQVLVERASARTAGFVRVDVKRREVLGGLVGSPLAVPGAGLAPVAAGGECSDAGLVPVSPAPAGAMVAPVGAMDLPDVLTPKADEKPAASARGDKPRPAAAAAAAKPPVAAYGTEEDLSDWIG